VRGYLLDTMILSYWWDAQRPEHQSVVARIDSLNELAPLRISAVTWGEIEYGHRCVSGSHTPIQVQFWRFVASRVPETLDIRKTTSIYYGQLRARLFDKFAPKNKKRPKHPEQLVDPVTATELGIQENDLWIAAQFVEHNLVLATNDRMIHIRQVAGDLLQVEDWVTQERE